MDIFIKPQDLGEFVEGEDWSAWTTPQQASADIESLLQGWCLKEDAVIWHSEEGTIEVLGIERFQAENSRGEKFYLVPKGTKVQLTLDQPLESESLGLHSWDDPASGETFHHKAKGVINLD